MEQRINIGAAFVIGYGLCGVVNTAMDAWVTARTSHDALYDQRKGASGNDRRIEFDASTNGKIVEGIKRAAEACDIKNIIFARAAERKRAYAVCK